MRLGVTDTLGNTDYWIYECVNKYIYIKRKKLLCLFSLYRVSVGLFQRSNTWILYTDILYMNLNKNIVFLTDALLLYMTHTENVESVRKITSAHAVRGK